MGTAVHSGAKRSFRQKLTVGVYTCLYFKNIKNVEAHVKFTNGGILDLQTYRFNDNYSHTDP